MQSFYEQPHTFAIAIAIYSNIDPHQFLYRGMMLSHVPNSFMSVGYTNARYATSEEGSGREDVRARVCVCM